MQTATTYQQRIDEISQRLRQTDARLKQLSFIRLLAFVGILFTAIQYFRQDFHWPWLAGAFVLVCGFVWSLARYQKGKDHQAYLKELLSLNEKERKLVTGGGADFEDGEAFIDDQHDFSGDLDVFGPSSLYQHINRTGTLSGKTRLANWLKSPLQSAGAIRDMQAAVRELSPRIGFRQDFAAHARLANESPRDMEEIRLWKSAPMEFVHRKGLRIAAYAMPALVLGGMVYYGFTGTYVWMLLALFVNWGILLMNVKKVNAQHILVSNKEKVLAKFAVLLRMIGAEDWKGVPWLEAQKRTATDADRSLHALARVSNALDQRMNLLVGIVLNSIMLYDIHCMFRLERWKERHRGDMDEWLDAIALMETANSLATFAFNHPDYIFPEVGGGMSGTGGEGIGHPLIPENECVKNDWSIAGKEQCHIVTGSNMSGKSTFLRSVGVNWLLAMTGAPVCAVRFRCHPVRIMTSMRIRDSIARHTSYFQAELQRLQRIIDVLKSGEEVFIILDEILKGTNSEDKLTGSRELVKHFLQFRCAGMIATHDLELGALEAECPGQVRNYCFESSLDNGKLHFDYTMRPGIARNKNATFLMRQMGII
ncbi:MutS-related protein [Chitinophaga rhizosphaerae]|uniref:MutS-related protein n=1 Tax=Chitinophaga rhizosphaerae TaxID=1864947 RepID=UPI000F7FE0B9|nr:hypothetical protein [Chitinophaga rhizosphaerae]